jgi:hypothetical protein
VLWDIFSPSETREIPADAGDETEDPLDVDGTSNEDLFTVLIGE